MFSTGRQLVFTSRQTSKWSIKAGKIGLIASQFTQYLALNVMETPAFKENVKLRVFQML